MTGPTPAYPDGKVEGAAFPVLELEGVDVAEAGRLESEGSCVVVTETLEAFLQTRWRSASAFHEVGLLHIDRECHLANRQRPESRPSDQPKTRGTGSELSQKSPSPFWTTADDRSVQLPEAV